MKISVYRDCLPRLRMDDRSIRTKKCTFTNVNVYVWMGLGAKLLL